MDSRLSPALAALAVLAIASTAHAASAAPPPAFAPDAVLVKYGDATSSAGQAQVRAQVRATTARQLSRLSARTERLTLPAGTSVTAAVSALARDPRVAFAEPDWKITTAAISSDPLYTDGSLWGMYGDLTSPFVNAFGSQAAEAWAKDWTGSRSVAVGVIDEGIEVGHPDLAANIWSNPGEVVDGLDNDANGYVDDTRGWDFFNRDASVYDGLGDDHGTHVAGTIAAVGGNGIGVAGVNWDATLISGKFLGPNGGYISDAVRATDYMTDLKKSKGINIVATSNSWGGGGFSQAMQDAINRGGDQGILFVAAAGNASANNDVSANFPSNYQCTTRFDTKAARGWDCVVAVASITSTGARSSFTNYGATTVDLGAPGSSIHSTLPGGKYGAYSGTSMATPHVSGAIALCASIRPTLDAPTTRAILMATAAPTTSLAGLTVTGGRLDVGAMAGACSSGTVPVATSSGAFGKSSPGNGATNVKSPATLSWAASSGAISYEVCANTTGTTCANWVSTGTSRSYRVSSAPRSTVYWQVRAVSAAGLRTDANGGTWWTYRTR